MKYIVDSVIFYQSHHMALFLAIAMMLPTLYVFVKALARNWRLVNDTVKDNQKRHMYHLERLPFVLAYISCVILAELAAQPLLQIAGKVQTNWTTGLTILAFYAIGYACLVFLESGFVAKTVYLVFCLPILAALTIVTSQGVFHYAGVMELMLILAGLFYQKTVGNPLAEKYFSLKTIRRLEDTIDMSAYPR